MSMIAITPMMIRTNCNTATDTPTAIGIIVLSVLGTNGGVDGESGWSVLANGGVDEEAGWSVLDV